MADRVGMLRIGPVLPEGVTIVEYGSKDLQWEFRSGSPTMSIRPPCLGPEQYGRHVIALDPTPAYGHDLKLARETLGKVTTLAPPLTPVHLALSAYEEIGRTNGHATYVGECYHNDHTRETCTQPWFYGVIVFSGKRIPIHPGMTRYLVAHEYGHLVENWLDRIRYGGGTGHRKEISEEYRELRGLKNQPYYGPGVWHATPGEIFANDFRLLITGIEPEYWPHPKIARPEGREDLREWWDAALSVMASALAVREKVA